MTQIKHILYRLFRMMILETIYIYIYIYIYMYVYIYKNFMNETAKCTVRSLKIFLENLLLEI